jgi:hypothetical protein
MTPAATDAAAADLDTDNIKSLAGKLAGVKADRKADRKATAEGASQECTDHHD